MRAPGIRRFMVIGTLCIFVFPWLVYMIVHFATTGIPQPWSEPQNPTSQALLNQTISEIVNNSTKWDDVIWQGIVRKRLTNQDIVATISSPSGREIFTSNERTSSHRWMTNQQIIVMNHGKVLGIVRLYQWTTSDAIAAISAVTAAILAIFFVGWQMRRYVVRPLEALGRAARLIAKGDFEFDVPTSRVSEIAQVRTGFEVMVAGLQGAFERQAKLEEERRFFIGAVAHDLRTPLFALRGYLDGLAQGIASSPEKIAMYVAVCKEKSNQLDRLVADLFAFSKLEYMQQTYHFEELDVAQVIERSLETLRPLAEEKHLTIRAQAPSEPCAIMGDSHLLERAMNNLLDNALRHTPAGGSIFVKWRKDGKQTTISVRDTGPGFSATDLKHVFDPLYRGEASRSRETGGAGLGLTIARRIFSAHGGELLAANDPDGGAVLTGMIGDSPDARG